MNTYYEKNKEKLKAKALERYYTKKDEIRIKQTEWRNRNKVSLAESRKKWITTNPSYIMYHNAKRRAEQFAIPFDISWKDIFIPETCPILSIKLFTGVKTSSDNSPSLDRVIPELGYVRGNINVISNKANRLKNNGSLEDFLAIVTYLRLNQ